MHSKFKMMSVALLALGLAPNVRAFPAAPKVDDKADLSLELLWNDLMSTDETKAARATLGLAAIPTEAAAFLKARLRPVKVDEATVAQLVKQLDSDEFETRQTAAQELEYLGKYVKTLLEKHLADSPPTEAKRAIRVLLDKMPSDEKTPAPQPKLMGRSVSVRSGGGEIQIIIDGKPLDLSAYAPKPPPLPPAGWARAARAVAVLEYLATPEARQQLEKLAEGEADAPPTKAAKEALERLKGK